MGLTFQQKFYNIPEVYLIFSLNSNNFTTYRKILVGVLEAPEEDDLDFIMNMYTHGYAVERVILDELVVNGHQLIKSLNLNDTYKEMFK